jgi:hypothetical protein
LGENTKEISERLHQRISELDTESKRIKSVLFDAKLQYKSNEIAEDIYQQINLHTNELLDHIHLEKTEIKNIMNKLAQQTVENTLAVASSNDTQENPINIHDENNENLENSQQQISQELSDSINHNQESQEREKGQEELEESTPEISNIDENEHKEINPIITSTN